MLFKIALILDWSKVVRFLVTGATGFIGVWLVRHLLEKGHEVSVVARSDSLPEEISGRGVKVFKGDIVDRDSLGRAFQNQQGVFHLAGYVGYKKWEREIMRRVNVDGTQNVIDQCLRQGVQRLVHVSSVNAIGASFEKSVLNEESPYNLSKYHLGYSDTKKQAEDLVRSHCDKLDAVIINPSTVYGPGDMKKSSRSVQVKVAKGKFPFFTEGGVSIADVFEVSRAMLTAFENGRRGERYILAGENLTIKEVFDLIAQEAGVPPPKHHLPNIAVKALGKMGDIFETFGKKGPINSESAVLSQMYHWFDSSKAQRELNYRLISAKTCIHNSVQWMKDKGMIPAKL